jgi:multidrug efflux pump subunit AcrB
MVQTRTSYEVAALPGITHVELASARPYEISIEVSEDALRRYGLTFDQVARAVRQSSLDLPGGSLKTEGGEILLRTVGQAYRGHEFEKLVLLSRADGTRLTLGEVAKVVDGFEETDQTARFDGMPSVVVQVFRVGQQSALQVSESVHTYVEEAQARMPEGIKLITWADQSEILRSRLDTLLRNGRDGFLLVLAVLALFLRLRMAFWILLGIPLSFLGTLWLMPSFDVSINAISLFAFIVVLGILVDDAIVVGENVHTQMAKTSDRLKAAIVGTQQVAMPVIFGVLTTVAAFVPLLTVPGPMGKFMRVIPVCVIACLMFSLVESMFVLPSHLTHGNEDRDPSQRNALQRFWYRIQGATTGGLAWFIERVYRPLLRWALTWRYLTLSIGISVLLLTVGLVGGRWVLFTFFPNVEADNAVAYVSMPQGTPADVTAESVQRIEASARTVLAEIEAETGAPVVRHVMASVGEQPFRLLQGSGTDMSRSVGAHLGEVNIELVPSEERRVTSADVMRRWRAATGQIPGAVELVFSSTLVASGEPINVQLQGPDIARLRHAAERLKTELATYPGVADITDSFRGGKQELELTILPSAELLGLTMSDLGRQVRQAFYGEEAQRIQRGRDEVKVMVRYPAEQRRSLGDIESMRIRTADGQEVPFQSVARVDRGVGFASIRRSNRERIINVTADVDAARANANEVVDSLRETFLPQMRLSFPNVSYTFEGEQREQAETLGALGRGFLIALLAVFGLLAVPLASYVQPFIIMTAIPFGLVGAVWGHLLMGRDLSMFSVIGIVALAGVVVNDSLVLVNYVNEHREEGIPASKSVCEAGAARFRPILLTSLTTFAGLTPLMLERSVQAQLLIPMAISLAFGVLFATMITLILVPALYLIIEDAKSLFHRSEAEPETESRTMAAPLLFPERKQAS